MEQYTQIPNYIIDEWMSNMKSSSFKVLMVICRKTLGWQKESDYISQSQIMEITGLSKNAVIRALAELKDKELINVIERQGITTNYTLNLTSSKTEPVPKENHTSSKTEPEPVPKRNTQKKNKETIQNKYYTNGIKELIDKYWNNSEIFPTHSESSLKRNIKKKHFDIIYEYGIESIQYAIQNYYVVLFNKGLYWFNYKWTFWDFISRGVDKFVNSADPLNNYKIKDKQPDQKLPSYYKKYGEK